jgi:hypothetical protein
MKYLKTFFDFSIMSSSNNSGLTASHILRDVESLAAKGEKIKPITNDRTSSTDSLLERIQKVLSTADKK